MEVEDGGPLVLIDSTGRRILTATDPSDLSWISEGDRTPDSRWISDFTKIIDTQEKYELFAEAYFVSPAPRFNSGVTAMYPIPGRDNSVGVRQVEVRTELGRILARESPVDADVVSPIPDSGVCGASVAVVGETGSGKTTFSKLLCRDRKSVV